MKKLLLVTCLFISCSKSSDQNVLNKKIEAARVTAQNNVSCSSLTDFYWEIGDKGGVIVSGATGSNSIQANTPLPIASASKFIWGIYSIEKKNANLSQSDIKYLTMSSGYTSFGNFTCVPNSVDTVQKCFQASSNATYTAANDGKFYYNGGHFQKMAMEMNLGLLTESELASEVTSTLKGGFLIEYSSPQLAGGITTTGLEYGKILRKVVNQELLMYQKLGSNAVCTDCLSSESSPMTGDIQYSLGHWVESGSDGAFSSAGLFGFYPWIDASKTYYGLISRYEVPSGNNEIGSGYASLLCGTEIRKAFMSGESR